MEGHEISEGGSCRWPHSIFWGIGFSVFVNAARVRRAGKGGESRLTCGLKEGRNVERTSFLDSGDGKKTPLHRLWL